ncbi:hypothetical protein [Streptomyces rimosus]|uniref:hypothetical protein n=1 Tax=Streptomyces rimosus TaxID=1927 RepID=UPI002D21A790|nr:hypothetical protein [Streptomyces rimosus]
MTPAPELRHFSHADLPDIRQTLIDVHADVHAARMADDKFRRKFPWFVDHWGGNPGFSCVVAYDGSQAVGFAYGAPGAPGREWWRGQEDRRGPAVPGFSGVRGHGGRAATGAAGAGNDRGPRSTEVEQGPDLRLFRVGTTGFEPATP